LCCPWELQVEVTATFNSVGPCKVRALSLGIADSSNY
jgi:hypothetical protein